MTNSTYIDNHYIEPNTSTNKIENKSDFGLAVNELRTASGELISSMIGGNLLEDYDSMSGKIMKIHLSVTRLPNGKLLIENL